MSSRLQMMRRDPRAVASLAGWLAGVLCLAVLSSLAPARAVADEKIKIAIGEDFAPFEFVDENGEVAGLVADVWRLWSAKTGTPVEFLPLRWAETLEAVRTGRADVHAGLNKNADRERYLDFSKGIYSTHVALFFPSGMRISHKKNKLAGFEIGVLKGSFEETLIRERFPKAKLVSFPTVDGLYDALKDGRIALFADVVQTAFYNLSKRDILDGYSFDNGELLDTNYLYAAVAKGNAQLLDAVERGLDSISTEERAAISKKWLGKDISTGSDSLVIALYYQYPPMAHIDATGKPAGMLVDMWRLWAEKTGQPVTFKTSDWPETLSSLRDGTADIHFGLYHSDARAEWIGFSEPFYSNHSSLYKRSESPAIPPQADLEGKRIGVVSGYLQETYLRENYPKAEIVPLHDDVELITGLANGDIDLFLSEDPTVEDLLGRLGLQGRIESSGVPLISNGLYAGVRKDRMDLLEIVNKGLDAISHNEWERLEARWIRDPSRRFFGKTVSDRIGLNEREKAWIRENPVVHTAGLADWLPMDYVSPTGSHTGIADEIARLAAERVGLTLEFDVGPWSERLEMLREGALDLAPAIYWTEDRAKQLAYTKAYLPLHTAIFAQPDGPGISDISDLHGKTVAVERSYAIEETLRGDHPEVELLVVESTLDALKSVSVGQADAYIGSQYVGSYLIEQNVLHGVEAVALFGDAPLQLHMAVPNDRAILRDIFDKALSSISEKEKREIVKRYTGFAENRAASRSIVLSEEEKAWLANQPVVRLAPDPDFAPIEFFDGKGEYRGLAADLVRLAADRVGLELTVVQEQDWDSVMRKLKSREVDVVAALPEDEETSRYLNFTEPYDNFPSVIVTGKDMEGEVTVEDLHGKRVAVVAGWPELGWLKVEHPEIDPITVKDTVEGLNAVAFGEAAALISFLPTAHHFIYTEAMTNLRIAGRTPLTFPNAMAVRNDWPELHSILQKGLDSITDEERLDIFRRWVGSDIDLSGQVAFTSAERKWIAAHPELQIGVDPAWPPFEYRDDAGVYSGVVAGYVAAVSERTGIGMVPVPDLTWSEVIDRARAGEIDVLPGITRTPSREAYLNFTRPFVSFPIVIVTRKDAPYVNDIGNLQDRKVAVVRSYVTEEFIRRDFPDLPLQTVNSVADGLEALDGGNVDALVANLAAVTYEMERLQIDSLKIAAPTEYKHELSMGVRKEWPELVGILDKSLASLSDAERTAIKNAWIAVRYNFGLDVRQIASWAIPIGLAILIVIASVLWWNRKLGGEIAERKKAEEGLLWAKEEAESALGELRETQEKLVTTEKMASLGQLTAGIAHEIKNPLNFVNNFSETSVELMDELEEMLEPLQQKLDANARDDVDDVVGMLKGDLQKIHHHGRRADSIVKSMLMHARDDGGERVSTSINELVAEAMNLAYHGERARDHDFKVNLEEEKDANAGTADLLPQEITRVLVNLFSNAFYAVKQRQNGTADSGYVPTVIASTKDRGDEVEIRVRDNGTGLTDEVRQKLFDPFFTTKPTGEGTGLGLSMSFDIVVQRHGGRMEVASEAGAYTEFVIGLPRRVGVEQAKV